MQVLDQGPCCCPTSPCWPKWRKAACQLSAWLHTVAQGVRGLCLWAAEGTCGWQLFRLVKGSASQRGRSSPPLALPSPGTCSSTLGHFQPWSSFCWLWPHCCSCPSSLQVGHLSEPSREGTFTSRCRSQPCHHCSPGSVPRWPSTIRGNGRGEQEKQEEQRTLEIVPRIISLCKGHNHGTRREKLVSYCCLCARACVGSQGHGGKWHGPGGDDKYHLQPRVTPAVIKGARRLRCTWKGDQPSLRARGILPEGSPHILKNV